MDDTCFLDSSRQRLQNSVDLANQFYHIHDIFINGDKCDLLAINPSTPKPQRNICIGQARTLVQATTKEVRYLGVWLATNQPRKLWMTRLKATVKGFLDVCGKKSLGIGHLAYLVNRVLIPKLLYLAQLMTLKEREWDIIFQPVLGMVKRQIQVARSFPTAAIIHEGLTGINSPWHSAVAQTVSLFTTIVNENTIASVTSLIRLRQAQLNQLLTTPIWNIDRVDLPLFYGASQRNLSLHALIVARSLNISFTIDGFNSEDWSVRGGSIPLRDLIIESGQLKCFKKFLIFKKFPIFFMDQLYSNFNSTLSWNTLKRLNGLSCKGRVVRWFESFLVQLQDILKQKMLDTSVINTRGEVNATLDCQNVSMGHHNLYFWEFLPRCSNKRTTKPFVIIRVWDTNDPSLIASKVFNIGKVVDRDSHNRMKIQLYRLIQPSDEEWQKVVATKYFLHWIPGDEIRVLYTKNVDSNLVIHRDYVNLINHWSKSPIMVKIGASSNQSFTKLPSESTLLNSRIDIADQVATDVWINRWVKDESLKSQLRRIATALNKETNLNYYTDGSLSQEKSRILNGHVIPAQTHMGAAFVLQHDTSLGCCAQIIHWPSSTRAELAAIFMALLTAPIRSNVKIFTDSATAIQLISKGQKGLSTRKWLKTPNSLWIMNIIALIKEKGLTLEMVKVKGHSGDVLNDLADELAKERAFCSSILDVPFISTKVLPL